MSLEEPLLDCEEDVDESMTRRLRLFFCFCCWTWVSESVDEFGDWFGALLLDLDSCAVSSAVVFVVAWLVSFF